MTPGYWGIWRENPPQFLKLGYWCTNINPIFTFGAGCYPCVKKDIQSNIHLPVIRLQLRVLPQSLYCCQRCGLRRCEEKTQTTLSGPLGEEHVFASMRHAVLRKMDSDLQEQKWYWKFRDNIFLESTFIWLSNATSVHAEKIKGRSFSWLHFSSLFNHQPLLFTFEIVHRYGGSPLLVPEIRRLHPEANHIHQMLVPRGQ